MQNSIRGGLTGAYPGHTQPTTPPQTIGFSGWNLVDSMRGGTVLIEIDEWHLDVDQLTHTC